ncbi:MAG: signal peptide peptidase SppA [Acidobacteria bacterium]|nr:MAG: signal peptide peptidase SppA [Acidobacteriota bacterium]
MTIRWWRKNRVALVQIEGIITDSQFGASRDEVLDALEQVESVGARAAVVRINSPGGTVGAAQEMHDGIKEVRKKGIPVVAALGDVAASGGLYVALAADKIVSNPGTITGSIGVIVKAHNLRQLYEKIGIEEERIKSGRYKDILSTFRPLTDEERALLQDVINDTYEQFLRAVVQGRHLPEERVRAFADGRIFTGRQAKQWGLVDELGGLQRAVELAAQMGGIVGKPKKVPITPRKRGLLGRLFTAMDRVELEIELLRGLGGVPLWLMPM